MTTFKLVTLTPKTTKAARHIADAGHPDSWVIVERRYSVPHNERFGPWIFVRPNTSQDPNFHARWVHEFDDVHFKCDPI
jgi:hypothetical protein